MEARELRIGNWVSVTKMNAKNVDRQVNYFTNYEGSLYVTCDLFGGQNGFVIIDDVEPIPLTEEWLEKFGFNQLLHSFAKDRFYITKWDKFDKWAVTHWGTNASIVNVKYLHQLQNLYFALTGEELELKD